MSQRWAVKINDGPEQSFETRTGVYRDAAAAAYAMLPFDETDDPTVVEIWAPELVGRNDCGPFAFRMDVDEFGRRVVTHLVRVKG